MTTSAPAVYKGHRLWIPTIIAMLASIGIMVIRLQPELERNSKTWASCAILALTLLLLTLWFAFLSRLRWSTRLITLGSVALAVVAMTKLLRLDGTMNGIGLPRFTWRWTPVRMMPLDAPPAPPPASAATTNLASIPDSPQFFGPRRDGTANGVRLARDWSVTPPKQIWRQPIGAGWSAFAISGGLAYTQEQRGEDEVVSCYDALTGGVVWTHANHARFYQWQGGEGPRGTPTVYRGRVFALGATGVLDCLDALSGELVWSHDVLKENNLSNLTWGVSASPLVLDDVVAVTGGMNDGPTVLAYHRVTGKPLWQAGKDKASYASPMAATLGGRRVILSVNAASLTAHDPATGEVLLDQPWGAEAKWPKAAQPVALDASHVFLSAGYGIGCRLLEIKEGVGGKLASREVWRSMRMKTQFNSVARRDGFLYGLDDGALACVDAATGERKWKSGHFGSGQTLLADDLILVQSEAGPVSLAVAKPDGFEQLGQLPALSSKTWNYPTLAGRYLFVRNDREAACYELPVQEERVGKVE